MPVVDPSALAYEDFSLKASDFVAGNNDGETLDAGQIGELATLEVGEDGQASSYDALIVGQPAQAKERPFGNEFFVDVDDTGDADVADSTEWRLVARDKNSNRRRPLTRWFSCRDSDQSDVTKRTSLYPQRPVVKAGRLIVLEVKNESTSQEISLSDSDTEIPAQGGY